MLIGYPAATESHLPYWRVLVLLGLKEVSRPPVDPDAVHDVELTAELEATLAGLMRDSEQRRTA
ncbi:hypothetical protein [Streptacidiphilus anmyonensis]|uniref:hypothetical protein n=1 Tax=Streptacidiphilus anmyonensis TaxID=405782 RepID=UPI0005AA9BE6|nr:hypothetical protein [Streptacidiphilus anmyonensis]